MHGSTFELDTRASTHLSQAPNPHNSFVSYVHGNNIARQYQMCSLTTAVSRLAPSAPCFSMSAKLHNTDTAENNYSSTHARTHAHTHTHTHTHCTIITYWASGGDGILCSGPGVCITRQTQAHNSLHVLGCREPHLQSHTHTHTWQGIGAVCALPDHCLSQWT